MSAVGNLYLGVAKLYSDIVKNGYKIMYLTSRAIGQVSAEMAQNIYNLSRLNLLENI